MGVKGSSITHYPKTRIRIYHELPEHKTATRYIVVAVEDMLTPRWPWRMYLLDRLTSLLMTLPG